MHRPKRKPNNRFSHTSKCNLARSELGVAMQEVSEHGRLEFVGGSVFYLMRRQKGSTHAPRCGPGKLDSRLGGELLGSEIGITPIKKIKR
jgi:hypothetical protein